jgi:hypothetical protein
MRDSLKWRKENFAGKNRGGRVWPGLISVGLRLSASSVTVLTPATIPEWGEDKSILNYLSTGNFGVRLESTS